MRAQTVEVGEREAIPRSPDFHGIVSLGGPMSADDPHEVLAAERALLASAAEHEVPVLGVCLGAQLLAHALGARIYPNPAGREVGVSEVLVTEDGRSDPLLAGLPNPLPVMQWHGDAFELPAGASLLATSPACTNQAFRFGRRAYGVLFHPEVGPAEARDWLSREEYREYAAGAHRVPDEIAAEARALGPAGVRLFENWLDLAV
ncbi:MAG: type 1 glutamine amidotransferase [Actinomycetota bacterium]|nr:type 1 glutamine amidotransferase [Actinomycetota bacterium]